MLSLTARGLTTGEVAPSSGRAAMGLGGQAGLRRVSPSLRPRGCSRRLARASGLAGVGPGVCWWTRTGRG